MKIRKRIEDAIKRALGMEAPIPCPTHGFDCNLPNSLRKHLVAHFDYRDLQPNDGFGVHEGLSYSKCLAEKDRARIEDYLNKTMGIE